MFLCDNISPSTIHPSKWKVFNVSSKWPSPRMSLTISFFLYRDVSTIAAFPRPSAVLYFEYNVSGNGRDRFDAIVSAPGAGSHRGIPLFSHLQSVTRPIISISFQPISQMFLTLFSPILGVTRAPTFPSVTYETRLFRKYLLLAKKNERSRKRILT